MDNRKNRKKRLVHNPNSERYGRRKTIWLIAATLVMSPASAWGFVGQATTPAGAAFSASCAGLGFSGGGQEGDAFNNGQSSVTPSVNCQTSTSSIGGTANSTVSDSGTDNGATFSNAATGQATPKAITLSASNSGQQSSFFPGAQTNAGWNDMITLSMGGQSGSGVWVVPIYVTGNLSATGLGALAKLGVAAYLNNAIIESTNADTLFFANNTTHFGTVASSWDYELVEWEATDYGPTGGSLTLQSLIADYTINFYIPFTWGDPFELGIFAEAAAGEISSGGIYTPNSAAVDPPNATWAGPGYVLDGGTGDPITGFSIASLSGTDYMTPYSAGETSGVPEPMSLTLFGLGLVGLGFVRRRRAS